MVAFTALSAYDLFVSQIADKPDNWPRLANIPHPGIPWYFWVIGLLLILLVGVLEGSYQEHQRHVDGARFELSDPISAPNQTETVLHDGKPWQVQVDLWRVRLTNTRPNSQASNVSIQITKSDPSMSMLPVVLHKKHDNTEPYTQSWTLRYNEPIEFDVVGYYTLSIDRDSGRPSGRLYLYRSDTGSPTIPFQIPIKEILQAVETDGLVLTISVFADIPTKGIQRQYRAFVDSQGQFKLESCDVTNSR